MLNPYLSRNLLLSLQSIFDLNTYMIMKTGDNVLISPEVTHKSEWTQGKVIEVEDNPFVGTVISAQTPSGEIYFDKIYQFKPVS